MSNEECDKCTHGGSVSSGESGAFHICFMPHDKRKEDKCSHFTLPESVKEYAVDDLDPKSPYNITIEKEEY